MKANLLMHLNSFIWDDLAIDRSEAIEDIALAISLCNNNEDDIYSHPLLHTITLRWGDLYEIITLPSDKILRECPWLTKGNQITLAKLFGKSVTPNSSESLMALNVEFPNENNSWLGLTPVDSPKYVSDEDSWKIMHQSFIYSYYDEIDKNSNYFKQFYVPKFRGSPNQVRTSILKKQEHDDFERLDVPKFVENDITLHGEQIQMHFKNGAALNMNGVWKHGTYNITTRAKRKLINWGFIVPDNS